MATKIALESAPTAVGTRYPPPYDEPCRERVRQRLGEAAGLKQFGVNLLRLPPGSWSSQRHWHRAEDEFVYIVAGEVVLVTDAGEQLMRAGECAGFPAGAPDGHHLQNRSASDALVLEVGSRRPDDEVFYPGIDLMYLPNRGGFVHADGTPYVASPRERPTSE
jgi:uncharacterized cupin superfamily protein